MSSLYATAIFTLENILKFTHKTDQCTTLLITQNLEFLKYPHSKETPRSHSRERREHRKKEGLRTRVMEKSLWQAPISLMLFFQLAIVFFFGGFTGYI
jgi:hypothetical protein